MNSYTIFAIDNDSDLHTVSKFMRHIDTQKAMGKMQGTMKPCIGSYKGKLEQSYIVSQEDFDKHVKPSGYVDKQESFLVIEDGHRGVTYGKLVYSNNDADQPLGVMRATPKDKALACEAWTYRQELDTYYVCS